MRKIEIEFPCDVEPIDGFEQLLTTLLDVGICKHYESANPTRVMWVSGQGSKPTFSVADCAFLGKTPTPGAPLKGEPTFDDSIYSLEISEREDLHGNNPHNPDAKRLREEAYKARQARKDKP